MASSPDRTHIDSTIYADIKARRFIGCPDALRCCRRYSGNFAVTGEIEPYRMKMRCFRTARPSVGEAFSDGAIVAAVRCHWRRPEAWPARGQAVGRSLLQSAECAGRAVRLCASRCHWPDERSSVPLPPPFQYSLVGSHRTKSNEETQSGSWKIALSHYGVEMLANGGLSPLVQQRPQKERPACNEFTSGREALRFPMSLARMASPCRGGDSRSRPQAAKRGRGTRQP